MNELKAPWASSYGTVKTGLTYPDISMSDVVIKTADAHPDLIALSCMGKKISYKTLKRKIIACANAFAALGIRAGDKVTICMPNLPQTVYALYGLNYIGAVASMIHPLSAQGEIAYYLKEVDSHVILTLDVFYKKIRAVSEEAGIEKIVLTTAADELGFVKKSLYKLINAKKSPKTDVENDVIKWRDFTAAGKTRHACAAHSKADELAVLLFSGGTTGVNKGIKLSNYNFNASAVQTDEVCDNKYFAHRMLAAMPCFHGFGLGVCIHSMLVAGGESVLVPKFNVKEYSKLIKKRKPNFMAGVPTLFEAMTRDNTLDGVKLDFLMGVFCGGDSLSVELKRKFDKFLSDHGATVRVREGYGLTECVGASCLTPVTKEKERSIGIPYPDMYFKICKPSTSEEVPYGTDGEIVLSGPTVMLGYYCRPEEDELALKVHPDGRKWLHTGDIGMMDEEGFVYFKQRIKRMIVTSGYNVYPSQVENVLNAHEAVDASCVIGVKDDYKMQKVKAFVVLKEGFTPSEELKKDILDRCKKFVAKYAVPYDVEFRKELPKTLVGKIAYTALEKEEQQKNLPCD